MAHRLGRLLLVSAIALPACAPGEGGPGQAAGAGRRAVSGALVVTPLEAESRASGERPLFEVGFRQGLAVRPLALPGPFVAAQEVWGAALVVDERRELWLESREGRRERLGRDVEGTPALSGDRETLAYVERRASGAELRLRRARGGPRVLASGLQSAGALRFSPSGGEILFVGASSGGVAGLQVAEVGASGGGARCLTNCGLVVGRPWGEAFVPLPRGPADLDFAGEEVGWEVEGRRFSVRYRGFEAGR